MDTDFSNIAQNALYRTSDLLFASRQEIEKFLHQRTRKLYALKESIILYDLTNTYFEGEVKQYTKAKRSKSKDKRNDRPLATLGLVLDEKGFPKNSQIFKGNVSEPSTLIEMVSAMHKESQTPQPPLPVDKPTVVLDAGIANHHQKPERIEGHIFISVLTYHLLQSIRYRLQQAGINHRWITINKWLRRHELVTTRLPKEDGRLIHLGQCTTPTLKQREVYQALGISCIPLRSQKIEKEM